MGCWEETLFKCPGHMPKMASTPIYGKLSKISFFGTTKLMTLKLGLQHWILNTYQSKKISNDQICSNDDTGLALTIFDDMVKFVLESGSLSTVM